MLLSVQGLLPRIALGVFLPSSINPASSCHCCQCTLVSWLPEHTREKKPFQESNIFPPSSVHIASSFHFPEVTEVLHCWLVRKKIDSFLPSSTCTQETYMYVDKTKFLVLMKFYTQLCGPCIVDISKLCEAREKMNIWVAWLAWWPKFATAPTHTHTWFLSPWKSSSHTYTSLPSSVWQRPRNRWKRPKS